MKRLFIGFLYLTFFGPFLLMGQDASDKEGLLWEISGNGLSKKSYLFGSIHLYDARIFEFGDSLLAYLDACEAFASEVHLDSMLNYLNNRKPSPKSDSSILKKGEIPPPPPPPNSFKKKSWGFSRIPYKEGDYPAFMDAYLFGLARDYGKKLFGLEHTSHHMEYLEKSKAQTDLDVEVFDPNFDFRGVAIENLTSIYLKADLKELMEYFWVREDSLMELRNLEMTESLDQIMPKYALFSVVGVAHLYGKNGLLKLLKEKGYQLRNISYSFDNSGQNYEFKSEKKEREWQTISRKNQGYEISFPGQPFQSGRSFTQKLLRESFFYPDLSTGAYYFINSSDRLDENSSFSAVADSVKTKLNGILESEKAFDFKGAPAYEFILKNQHYPQEYFRFRLLRSNGQGFFLFVGGLKQVVEAKEVDYFFDSFQGNEIDRNHQKFTSEDGAFSVNMKGKPEYTLKKESIPGLGLEELIHIYSLINREDKTMKMIRYNDFPSGMYLENDTLIFAELLHNMTRRIPEYVQDYDLTTKDISLEGYPGREIRLDIMGGHILTRSYARGNRVYVVMSQSQVSETAEEIDFLDSFHFEPYEEIDLKIRTFDQYGVSLLMPSRVVEEDEDDDYGEILANYIYGNDEITGNMFFFMKLHMSKYAYYPGTDSLFSTFKSEYLSPEDSLISFEKVDFRGLPTQELVFKNRISNSIHKLRFILYGKYCYVLYALVPYELLPHPTLNAFFDSIEFLEEPDTTFDLTGGKFKFILDDMLSEDSLTRLEAKEYLYYEYIPIKEDLPFIYQALETDFSLDTNYTYSDPKSDILDLLEYEQDAQTLPFLHKFYLDTSQVAYREDILNILLKMQNEEAFSKFFELTEMDSTESDFAYGMTSYLTDSSELFRQFYPDILRLGKKNTQFLQLLFEEALQKEVMSPAEVFKYQDQLLAFNVKKWQEVLELEAIDQEERDDYPPYHHLLTFLRLYIQLPDHPASNAFLEKVIESDTESTWSKVKTLETYLSKGKAPRQAWILELLKNEYTYYESLSLLKEHKHLDKVPSQFLEPEKIAEAMMNELMYEYEYSEVELKFLSKEKVAYQGESGEVYAYQLTFTYEAYPEDYEYGSEEEVETITKVSHYLGIAGPISGKKKKIKFSMDLTGMSEDAFDFSNIDLDSEIKKLVEETLQSYED